MKLDDPLPAAVGWITRGGVWGVGGAIMVAIVVGYGRFKLADHIATCLEQPSLKHDASVLVATQEFVSCVDARSGPLERFLLGPSKRAIAALPNTPCAYLGTWSATRDAATYKVTLTDDSKFVATPDSNTPPGAETISGAWGIDGGRMIWLYDEGHFWPPDINPITNASADAFTLTEANGATTRYVRIDGKDSTACRR